jgi:hypothetical protein
VSTTTGVGTTDPPASPEYLRESTRRRARQIKGDDSEFRELFAVEPAAGSSLPLGHDEDATDRQARAEAAAGL